MKVFILFLFSSLCYSNFSAANVLQHGAAKSFRAAVKCQLLRNKNLDVSNIDVYFYDFRNSVRSFPVDKAAQGILSMKNLKKANKFFLYVGGFRSHIKEKATEMFENAFRKIDNSYLIIVDHSKYTHGKDDIKKSYERSVTYVPDIGKRLAKMLADLKTGGVSPKTMHCIGHSLGGQILGHVGENFIRLTGQKISRITALDPAGPCFEEKWEHIRSGVADYVEVYHCNDVYGSQELFGDVDFIANNGKSQPECGNPSWWSPSKVLETSKCSHNSCVNIWTASVLDQNRYPAYECPKHSNLKDGMCSKNKKTTAGFWNPGTAKGKYYFSTDGYKF